jgi:hypothetical protein
VECKAIATCECQRCLAPHCTDHSPGEDERCRDCEAHWLEVAPEENPLGTWGPTSLFLVKTMRWSTRALLVAILPILVAAMIQGLAPVAAAILYYLSLGLLILGVPVAGGCVLALPAVRAAERAWDYRFDLARQSFLKEASPQKSLPSASEGPVDAEDAPAE